MAVRTPTRGGNRTLLAERWNGTNWAIQRTPKPAGAKSANFRSVSCPSPSVCIAVGSFDTRAGTTVVLAERWNGTNWAIQRVPKPTGAKYGALAGVSCASKTACTAVGVSSNSTGDSVLLAERWNGTGWAIQRIPNAKDSALDGVSCSSRSACIAVGVASNSTGDSVLLAERWNGTNWAIQRIPSPARGSSLASVACWSRTGCVAVGRITPIEGGERPLAERWNGTSWAIQRIPNPAGTRSTYLSSVSCAAKTACTAVGHLNRAGRGMTLAERWNGTNWAIQRTSNPIGAPDSYLDGVSCASKTRCIAVGYSTNLPAPIEQACETEQDPGLRHGGHHAAALVVDAGAALSTPRGRCLPRTNNGMSGRRCVRLRARLEAAVINRLGLKGSVHHPG